MGAHPRLQADRVESRLEHLVAEMTSPATNSSHRSPKIRSCREIPLAAGALVAAVVAAIVVVVGVTPSSPRATVAFALSSVSPTGRSRSRSSIRTPQRAR
jgi:hypothetical protein